MRVVVERIAGKCQCPDPREWLLINSQQAHGIGRNDAIGIVSELDLEHAAVLSGRRRHREGAE